MAMNIVTKSYESLLPFLVVEAISTQGESFKSMSVRMIDEGWAWIVSKRKLLIWKFKESGTSHLNRNRRMLSPCFELQLPQSDLCHKAELINVFFMPQNPNTSIRSAFMPAALAVSPEGTVRFWSSIANERYTESATTDIQGQEFCTLVQLSQLEYLIGTTTGSIFIMTIDVTSHDPKNILSCTALNTSAGILSGFSRRMTNLFFGPHASEVDSDTRRPLIAVPKYTQTTIDKIGSTNRPFFVMSSSFKLRQWSRTNEGPRSSNELVKEWDFQQVVHRELLSSLKFSESENLNFWPIDMITNKSKELVILIVTLNTARNNVINYATCIINPYLATSNVSKVAILHSHSWNYSNESEEQLLALRFLERRISSSIVFLYDRKFLFLTKIDQDILDAIDFGNQDDSILGAGVVDGHTVMFTQRDGLIYVVPTASNRTMNETSLLLEPPQVISNQSQNQSKHESLMASASARIDPMIVEVDENDEDERPNNQSRQVLDNTHQTSLNQSEQPNLNRSAAESPRSKSDTTDILKEKQFEWVLQIDSKQYGLASETLAKLAEDGELLTDRKPTLIALSKLAKLAE